jgi:hypothetical protein
MAWDSVSGIGALFWASAFASSANTPTMQGTSSRTVLDGVSDLRVRRI